MQPSDELCESARKKEILIFQSTPQSQVIRRSDDRSYDCSIGRMWR